jgi:hypothetical protein
MTNRAILRFVSPQKHGHIFYKTLGGPELNESKCGPVRVKYSNAVQSGLSKIVFL